MPIINITSLHHPGVEIFHSLTEAQLRHQVETENGLFIAESPKVIRVALDAGYQPLALLCEERHITGDAADIIARHPEMPVYTGSRDLLTLITGYKLTRGVLCAMQRRPMPTVEAVCRDARRVVVIDNVVDTTNIGAIFRSAAALGIDAVLLTPNSCDPLNRRSVRVSMGSVFLLPWTWIEAPLTSLHALGFKTAAMALTDKSVALDNPQLMAEPRLAIIMGTEGDGLADGTIDMIATDHAPHSAEEKGRGLEKSAMGIVGLETAFPLLYTYLVKSGVISMERLMELLHDAPCRRFNILTDTGFTVFDLNDSYHVDPADFLSMGKATPFTGWEVQGRCLLTATGEGAVWCDEERLLRGERL